MAKLLAFNETIAVSVSSRSMIVISASLLTVLRLSKLCATIDCRVFYYLLLKMRKIVKFVGFWYRVICLFREWRERDDVFLPKQRRHIPNVKNIIGF